MDIQAHAKYIRVSPQKARLVAAAVRRLSLDEAMTFLDRLPVRSAGPVKKVIGSAIANAENNHKIGRSNLYIRSISVDEGMFFKRFRAAPRGMAHGYEKRTSHISVVLGVKKEGTVASRNVKKAAIQKQEKKTEKDMQPAEKTVAVVEKRPSKERIRQTRTQTVVPRQVTRQKKGM